MGANASTIRPAAARGRFMMMYVRNFWAETELIARPGLRDRPFVVTDGGGRRARVLDAWRFVPSPPPGTEVNRLPDTVLQVPRRLAAGEAHHQNLQSFLEHWTPATSSPGFGHYYADLTGTARLFGSAEAVGRDISGRLPQQMGFAARLGIASRPLTAYLAARSSAQGSVHSLRLADEQEFMAAESIFHLPGLPRHFLRTLYASYNIKTVGQLLEFDAGELWHWFGQNGRRLYKLLHGTGALPGKPVLSAEVRPSTFRDAEVLDPAWMRARLFSLCGQLAYELRRARQGAELVEIYALFRDKYRLRRRWAPSEPIADQHGLYRGLLNHFDTIIGRRVAVDTLRLEVVRATSTRQLELFAPKEGRRCDPLVDRVREKYGYNSVRYAAEGWGSDAHSRH